MKLLNECLRQLQNNRLKTLVLAATFIFSPVVWTQDPVGMPLRSDGVPSSKAYSIDASNDSFLFSPKSTLSFDAQVQKGASSPIRLSNRYLLRDASGYEGSVARYLWEDSTERKPILNRYLWDETSPVETEVEVARYLWDDASDHGLIDRDRFEKSIAPNVLLSRYLWDEGAHQGESSNRYLWDDVTQTSVVLARYLWDEREAQSGSARALGASLQERLDRPIAGYLWEDFNGPYQSGSPIRPLKGYLGGKNHLLERNSQLQIAGSNLPEVGVRKTYLSEASEVVLTGLDYSVRGDAALQFLNNHVSWTIKNQGQRSLKLKSLTIVGPSDNPIEEVDLSSGETLSTHGAGFSEVLELTGQIEAGETLTVAARFLKPSKEKEEDYAFSIEFKNGQKLDFAPKQNLPLQTEKRDAFYPTLIRADELHRAGFTGDGVGVAVIDTGAWAHPALENDTQGKARVVGFFDAVSNTEHETLEDENGHGSHITSVLASSERAYDSKGRFTGSFHGIAPDVDLLVVKAFNDESRSTYLDVVNAIAYVVKNRDRFNIKVLNLAFQGNAIAHYWQDPINQAVMAAWDAGITVVVSAGNSGPDTMTIGAPGNVPYVITVGAVTDHYTMDDPSDDYVATFSSVGPTLEGFIKPEMIAPGGHMMGLVPTGSTVTLAHPDFHDGFDYYLMSGTSQAAAAASGVAALMLQKDPSLSPDDVKCRLMASAKAAISDGKATYSLLQQGAGLIDAVAALDSNAEDCANQGLDLKADLAGIAHFKGPLADRKEVESLLGLAQKHRDSVVDDAMVFDRPLLESKIGLSSFNTVSLFDRSWSGGDVYVSLAQLKANGLNWSSRDLKDQGYLIDRTYHGLDHLAFDTRYGLDAQLMSSYLNGLKQVSVNPSSWRNRLLDSTGFIWNLSNPENAGFIWNLSNPENAGFIWNLSNPENAGFIWNLSNPENAGFIWNLSNPENAGFIWNLSNPENAGFIWNLSNPENAGFIWNL